MLLYELVEKCNYRNGGEGVHEQCEDCTYGKFCPHDCKVCLEYIHYPQRAPYVKSMIVHIWQTIITVNIVIDMLRR